MPIIEFQNAWRFRSWQEQSHLCRRSFYYATNTRWNVWSFWYFWVHCVLLGLNSSASLSGVTLRVVSFATSLRSFDYVFPVSWFNLLPFACRKIVKLSCATKFLLFPHSLATHMLSHMMLYPSSMMCRASINSSAALVEIFTHNVSGIKFCAKISPFRGMPFLKAPTHS